MHPHTRLVAILALVVFAAVGVFAGASHSERALWIKITEKGKLKTTIAVTEKIARVIAESEKEHVHFSHHKNKDKDLITRKMMLRVLDGKESSISVKDDDDTEAELYMDDLKIPGEKKEGNSLILETYKEGKRTFRMKMGEFEFESTDEETGETEKSGFSWRSMLPFLYKAGGGAYIHDHKDDSEIWIFVQ